MKEIWKDVKGFENRYKVSNLGKVKSLLKEEKILKGRLKENGYIQVDLFSKDGERKRFYVHRLVAMHFIENPQNKEFVNHKNFNKKDNSVDNLEWVTRIENFEHFYKSNKYNNFKIHKKETLQHKTLEQVKLKKDEIIRLHKENNSHAEIAKKLKIGKEFVSDVLHLFDIY